MNNLDGGTLAYFAIVILFGGGFAVTGFYVLFYSMRKYFTQQQKKRTFVQDFATIVDKKKELRKQNRGRGRMLMYQPIFEYLVKGKQYRLTGYFPNSNDWSSSVPKNGEKRVIWINPNDPNDAFVEEPTTEAVLVIVIGLVFSIIGLLILFFTLYNYKPAKNNDLTTNEQSGIANYSEFAIVQKS